MREAPIQVLGGILSFLALKISHKIVKSTRLFEMTVDRKSYLFMYSSVFIRADVVTSQKTCSHQEEDDEHDGPHV